MKNQAKNQSDVVREVVKAAQKYLGSNVSIPMSQRQNWGKSEYDDDS